MSVQMDELQGAAATQTGPFGTAFHPPWSLLPFAKLAGIHVLRMQLGCLDGHLQPFPVHFSSLLAFFLEKTSFNHFGNIAFIQSGRNFGLLGYPFSELELPLQSEAGKRRHLPVPAAHLAHGPVHLLDGQHSPNGHLLPIERLEVGLRHRIGLRGHQLDPQAVRESQHPGRLGALPERRLDRLRPHVPAASPPPRLRLRYSKI